MRNVKSKVLAIYTMCSTPKVMNDLSGSVGELQNGEFDELEDSDKHTSNPVPKPVPNPIPDEMGFF